MTPHQREKWAECIRTEAAAWAVGFASAPEIDTLGILPATRLAVRRALDQVKPVPQHLLLDYLRLPDVNLPQTPLVKGDARCLSIAAASVLAKTARDRWMCELDERIPGYGFARHKGYGTAAHYEALHRLGPCAEHRRTFAPVREVLPISETL
jgi:ribonuclease HII